MAKTAELAHREHTSETDALPALPPASAARVEAARAQAEVWFHGEAAKDRSIPALEETLAGYIFDLWYHYAFETYNAALALDWPAGVVRLKVAGFTTRLIEQTFNQKHPLGTKAAVQWPAQVCQANFRRAMRAMIQASDEWRQLQEGLAQLALSQVPGAADLIESAARERHLTHEGLADQIGISGDTLTRIKKETPVSDDSYRKVAACLDRPPDELKPRHL